MISYLKPISSFILYFFQPLPGGGGDPGDTGGTGIDLPIDSYIIIGMIVAVLISLFVIRQITTKTNKI